MKNLISLLLFIFSVNIVFSQVLVSEFNEHVRFNTGDISEYEKIIDDKFHTETFSRFGIINRYVFDIDNQSIYFYGNNDLISTIRIKKSEYKDSMWYIVGDDYCAEKKERMDVYFVLNFDKTDDLYPYFTYYYRNLNTKTFDVYISKN